MNRKGKKGFALTIILALVLLLSSCMQTDYEGAENVAEADELQAVLQDATTIVIDARSAEDYAKGHLKGAINLSASELTISEPVKNMLAPKEQVEKVLGSKGISNDSNIYIYEKDDSIYASRIWWTLKAYGHENVKVINNGEKALATGDFELTLEVPEIIATDYQASDVDKSMLATIEDVMAVVDGIADGFILDVRSTAEFEEGAIPGAILYPHTKNLYPDNTFKSAKTIYLNYNDLGIKKDDMIILYCKSSIRAAQTALLLEEAGYTNLKVYDGAWLEWSTKDMPKEEKVEVSIPSSQDGS